MRPTLQQINEMFDYYNRLCFDNSLPPLPITLNTRHAVMGVTRCRIEEYPDGTTTKTFSMEISVRRDLPEAEYVDTLIHEMIHYYIEYNNLQDDSVHGTIFKSMVGKIKEEHNITVTIAFNPSDEELVSTNSRVRYVCVADFDDGTMGIAVVAKNKVFQLWDEIPQINGVIGTKWFASNRAIFEKFPTSVSPCVMICDCDKIHHYLTGAVSLVRNGDQITVKNY